MAEASGKASGDKAGSSPVLDFYKGTDVFITGATGFLGVGLIEKLLRSVPQLGTVYLLVRPKKGKEISERLEQLTKNLVFEKLEELRGTDPFKSLVAVAGDVGEEGLALSPADRALLCERVGVVFHCAATLDFEAALKPTVDINLLGTRRVLQLCQQMSRLKAVVHVSSAYVNSDRNQADELLYPPPGDAEKIIGLTCSLGASALEQLTPKLLGDHPNTYTFTKNLAEHEVAKVSSTIPVVIVRPSMITSAWKEPVPGWTNSKNGPTGFLMGAAKGVVRRLPVGKDLTYDYIPVDIVINHMIVAAWHTGTTKPAELPVYHCTSGTRNPFRWHTVENKVNSYLHRFPLKSAVWYPNLTLLPSLLLFRISALFVHFLPAYVLDTVARITGGRPILVRLHTNIGKSLSRLRPFIFNEWSFSTANTLELTKMLSPEDKETFPVDISTLKWEDYFLDMARGVRRYLNNEEPRSLPAAIRKDNVLLVLHILLQLCLYSTVWWIGSILLGTTLTKSGWIVIATYIIFSFL